jgi:AMP phosphorylase
LLLPSIMSKKKAIGATHLVVDIPTGRGAKIKTGSEAETLAYDFIDLGSRLGIRVQCAVTFGEQPLGCAIGPALEAKEALLSVMGNGPADLIEKATTIAGILLEMAGQRNGKREAEGLLRSGKAETKLREIIQAQGGDAKIEPEDIPLGDKKEAMLSPKQGEVLWINNEDIARVAREAGAPSHPGAGVLLRAKIGQHVEKDSVLFHIFAETSVKLEAATALAEKLQPIGLTRRPEERMLMQRIPTRVVHKKSFVLER